VSKPKTCKKSEGCVARDIWSLLGSKIEEVLSGFTLAQLVDMQEEKSDRDRSMYYI
jgi:DNA-binding IscR family transcriptional regulator